MARISPLIQGPDGKLHIGSSLDVTVCGKRGPGLVGKGSVGTGMSRDAMLKALLDTGVAELCSTCFTPTVRQAYAQARG